MTRYLLPILLILSICSCEDSTKKTEEKIKPQLLDKTFLPDNFAARDDTASFNMDKGKLAGKTLTLDVIFGAIACTCAQWSETKYSNDIDNRTEFFLEPADTSLINADTLFKGDNFPIRLSVTGRFYLKEGYPENYRPAKGNPEPARVFRYTNIKMISTGKKF